MFLEVNGILITEEMLDLAFQYKKTKLWKFLGDDELVAVELSDGEIGYLCVMGMLGEHLSLALYVGAEGFQSYREIRKGIYAAGIREFSPFDTLLTQDCLQCSFEKKDQLSDYALKRVRAYTKEHGISLRGRSAFPCFTKYHPTWAPGPFTTEREQQQICEAFEAAIALSEMLKVSAKTELGIVLLDHETKTLPFLVRERGQWRMKQTEVPAEPVNRYSYPQGINEVTVARLRKIKKRGMLECGIRFIPSVVYEDEWDENGEDRDKEDTETKTMEEFPAFFPTVLLCIDPQSGYSFNVEPTLNYHDEPERLLNAFTTMLLEENYCPRSIHAVDERTMEFLNGLCTRTGIRLSLSKHTPAFDDLEEFFMEKMSAVTDQDDFDEDEEDEEELSDFAEMTLLLMAIEGMSDQQLRSMPEEAVEELQELYQNGVLPQKLADRLRRIFHFR